MNRNNYVLEIENKKEHQPQGGASRVQHEGNGKEGKELTKKVSIVSSRKSLNQFKVFLLPDPDPLPRVLGSGLTQMEYIQMK